VLNTMTHCRSRSALVVALFAAWTAASCGPDASPPPPLVEQPDAGFDTQPEPDASQPRVLATVEILEQPIIVELNQTRPLVAIAYDTDGERLDEVELTWTSSDDSILRVNAQGVAIARALGEVTLTASATDASTTVTTTATARVVGKAVAEVELIPRQRNLGIGESVELFVTLKDANRALIDEERPIEWESSAAEVVSVTDGVATGHTIGEAEIVAIVEGIRSQPALFRVLGVPVERIELSPTSARLVVGDTLELDPRPYDLEGNLLSGRMASFSSSDETVATVSATGRVTALTVGSTTITADIEGKTATTRVDVHMDFDSVTTGSAHVCVLVDRVPFCFGANDHGQLGLGHTNASPLIARVQTTALFDVLSAGDAHTCGLSEGRAFCWGNGADGRLGDGQQTNRSAPVAVAGDHRFTAISAGSAHTCAIDENQRLWCWGRGTDGQLGNGQLSSRTSPVQVFGNHAVLQVSAGSAHTCFVTTGNNGFCFGANDRGQLGTQNTTSYDAPTFIPGGYSFALLAAGREHTCGISPSGVASCFGANDSGQVGDGTNTDRSVPIYVPLPMGIVLTTLSVGADHSCGLAAGGAAYCWGRGTHGQLGDGQQADANQPVRVSGTLAFNQMNAGGSQTCALVGNTLYCWGSAPGGAASTPTRF
jgi:alpha-tubulin suppressor-like RCC1 family protein